MAKEDRREVEDQFKARYEAMEQERAIVMWEVEKRRAWVHFAGQALSRDNATSPRDAASLADKLLEEFVDRHVKKS